jgi:hypothetical protein
MNIKANRISPNYFYHKYESTEHVKNNGISQFAKTVSQRQVTGLDWKNRVVRIKV